MNMTDKQIEMVREIFLIYKNNPIEHLERVFGTEFTTAQKVFLNSHYGLKEVKDEMQ